MFRCLIGSLIGAFRVLLFAASMPSHSLSVQTTPAGTRMGSRHGDNHGWAQLAVLWIERCSVLPTPTTESGIPLLPPFERPRLPRPRSPRPVLRGVADVDLARHCSRDEGHAELLETVD